MGCRGGDFAVGFDICMLILVPLGCVGFYDFLTVCYGCWMLQLAKRARAVTAGS